MCANSTSRSQNTQNDADSDDFADSDNFDDKDCAQNYTDSDDFADSVSAPPTLADRVLVVSFSGYIVYHRWFFCLFQSSHWNVRTGGGCQCPTDISGSGFSGFLFGFLVVQFSDSFLRPSEAFSQVSFFYLFDLSIGLPSSLRLGRYHWFFGSILRSLGSPF